MKLKFAFFTLTLFWTVFSKAQSADSLIFKKIFNQAQSADSLMFKKIFDEALLHGQCYSRLGELCKTVGSRLSGSENAAKGIVWAEAMLKSYHFDTVFKQPVMVPCWQRSKTEELWMESAIFTQRLKKGFPPDFNCEAFEEQKLKPASKYRLQSCALGGSVGTGGKLRAQLVVVHSQKEMEILGKAGKLKGKIVLLNRAFDETLLNTFTAYSSCVDQRVNGAAQLANYGVLGVLVHSMTNRCDLHPHTGSIHYVDSIKKIPAMAVASAVANMLEQMATQDANMYLTLNLECKTLADQPSYNVIASTKGRVFPDKIIDFGGHFDSWDEGEGAHDDGAGCMHSFEALRILKAVGYVPKHTLRCVFFINEENGLRGGKEYARLAQVNKENHIAALESDRGGFVPRGFGVDSSIFAEVLAFSYLLDKYGIGTIEKGGGGADIGQLKTSNPQIVFTSLIPDAQRYFDVHHAETDVFENVNKRELEMGAASVAVMIWILDQILW